MTLLPHSGDVERNTGSSSNTSEATASNSSTVSYAEILECGLSIMHLNIQSLRPQIDIFSTEAQPYDILTFTETWLSSDISNDDLHIP